MVIPTLPRLMFLSACALAVPAASLALGDGDLDPRYGVGGSHSHGKLAGDLEATGLECDPAGNCYLSLSTSSDDFLVRSFDPAGFYDQLANANFDLGGSNTDTAYGIAVGGNGRPVVVGDASDATDDQIAVARFWFEAFLTLDESFSGNGKVSQNFNGDAHANAVAVGPQGEIVVVGCYETGGTAGTDFAILRFLSDGTPDDNFDGNAVRTLDFAHSSTADDDDCATAVAIEPDGQIVVAGYARYSGTDLDFAVARLETNGALDGTFFPSGGGMRTIFFDQGSFANDEDIAYDLALDRFGRIVIAGSAETDDGYKPALARLTALGALDNSFDTDGKFLGYEGVIAIAHGVAVLPFPSERVIYQTGHTLNALDDSGQFDATFAGGGSISIVDPNAVSTEAASRMTTLGGMPIVVGDSTHDDGSHTYINRYWMSQIFGDDFEGGNTDAWRGW